MSQTVSVPLWLFAVMLALAGWAALVLFLAPSVRWYFRRRVNRVISEINTRLNIDIPSFKVTRRQVLIDRLFHDPRVQAAVDTYCEGHQEPRSEVLHRVDRYAREIVPSFNAYLYFRIGYAVARAVAKSLYRVRVGFADDPAFARIRPKSTIVFAMNHRSNMDYVLVAFLAAERTALSYAVGEWARIWPLQQLIRAMGAYFVRRNSGDPLYRTVLQRYVQMATEAGVCQAMFPEGGLTQDGKLRAPRLGLLDYMVKAFDPAGERDLVFIPVGINYDRVLEDRTQLAKLEAKTAGRTHGTGYAIRKTGQFAVKNLLLALTGRWHRFGYACVNFGTPLSMKDYAALNQADYRSMTEDARHDAVSELGATLMQRVSQVIPVLPVSVVACVIERANGLPLSEIELKSRALNLMNSLARFGARTYIPRQDQDYAIGVGLRMLTLRRLVVEEDGLYSAVDEERAVLAYYANAIAHLVIHAEAAPAAGAGETLGAAA